MRLGVRLGSSVAEAVADASPARVEGTLMEAGGVPLGAAQPAIQQTAVNKSHPGAGEDLMGIPAEV